MLKAADFPLQAPGLVTSLASNPQVFSYKGTAYVTNVETKLRSDFDLSEPSMLSLGSKKHQVTFDLVPSVDSSGHSKEVNEHIQSARGAPY